MSDCKDCGQSIKWARLERNHERFLPPLEALGEVFMIDEDGAGIKVYAYKEHTCEVENVRAFQKKLAELRELGIEPRRWRSRREQEEPSEPPVPKCKSMHGLKRCCEDEGHVERDGILHHHGYDPDFVEPWTDDEAWTAEQVAELREKQWQEDELRRETARQLRRDKVNKPALLEACPRCFVGTGTMCISMSKNPKQAGTELKNVHPERQALAEKNGHYPDESAA